MNDKTRQGLGLVALAALAGLIAVLGYAGGDETAWQKLEDIATLIAVVCAGIGLVLLVVGLLRDPRS